LIFFVSKMKIIISIFIIFCIYFTLGQNSITSSQLVDTTCPNTKHEPSPNQVPLEICTQYNVNNACCISTDEEYFVVVNLRLFGPPLIVPDPNNLCYSLTQSYFCGYCSPQLYTFYNDTTGKLNICNSFCNQIVYQCQNYSSRLILPDNQAPSYITFTYDDCNTFFPSTDTNLCYARATPLAQPSLEIILVLIFSILLLFAMN